MLSSKTITRISSITCILVVLEIVYLFLNFGIVISQENNLVSETEVVELAEKFIQKNQDKVAFLVSARVSEPKLLYDENNKPTQWRVSILKGNKRLGSFNVLAFKAPNGVLPTWFYGPGDSKKWEIENKEMTTGGIKVASADGAEKKLDTSFPNKKIDELQKREEKGGALLHEGTSIQGSTLQKPNLAFYTPSGWDDAIVVSSVPGTNTHEETVSSPFYIDYAYANYSDYKAVGYIENQIYVSDDLVGYGHRTDLDPWNYSYLEDTEASVTSSGWHTVAVTLDHLDNIDESDENDNDYEVYVYVENGPVSEPILVESFTCSDYNNPYGTQTTTFYTTDDQACEFTEWNTWDCTRTWQARIDFWDPDGNVYYQANADLEPGNSSITFIAWMYISGYPAENMPGWWRALVSVEGAWRASDDFEIIQEGGRPELIEHWTCSDWGNPWGSETSTFYTTDHIAIEFTEWNTTACTRDWESEIIFYGPDRNVYESESATLPSGESSYIFKSGILIDGYYPANHPGNWSAAILLEGEWEEEDYFEIIEIPPEDITVTSPNGGEIWQAGTNHTITWTSSGTSGNVEIEYSTNGGGSWTTIASSTSDDGSYSWTIPNTPSTNCYVRITDVDGDPWDVSDNTFTISSPTENITVTSPNGGEVWQAGTSHTITWTSQNTSGSVKIEYSINSGISWTIITASTTDDGSHPWTIPNTPSTNCYVRITDVDGDPWDVSDNTFTISSPPENITITSPNGGEVWQAGTSHIITWTSQNTSGSVKIEYSINSGINWTIITASTTDDGSHPWTIPNPSSTNCYVRITDVDGFPSDMSDGPFTIPREPEWTAPLTISGGGTSFIRTFGGDADATAGLDVFDVAAAPPGMTYYAYFEIGEFPNYLDTDIREWMSPYDTDIDWTLKIVNTSGITSSLSWNTAGLPTEGTFTLVGAGLNVNMRSQGSAQVSGDANLTIQYRYRPYITVTYNFPQMGWYLVSLPLTPADNSLSSLFPTAMSAFAYDPVSGSYYSVTSLLPQKGYWLAIPATTTSTITGVALTTYTKHYNMGWHLIGSVAGTTNFTDPKDNPDGSVIATYGWNPVTSQYFFVYPPGTGQLNEMEGYWLAVVQSCDLTLGGTLLSQVTAAAEVDMESFYQRFGSQPPVPPFASDGSMAQSLSTGNMISRNYPNPFNPETVIEYCLAQTGFTRVYIYNNMGQRIRTLAEAQQSPGIHQVVWDGRNDNGEMVSNGIYFYRIITSEFAETRKMLLLK